MIDISQAEPTQAAILFAVGGLLLALAWFTAKAIIGHLMADWAIRKWRKAPRFEAGYWVSPDGVKFTQEDAARAYCKRYF